MGDFVWYFVTVCGIYNSTDLILREKKIAYSPRGGCKSPTVSQK